MIRTLGALVLPGLVNYAIMESALKLRDAGYVKWSAPILAELKECVQGFIDYSRYLDPNSSPVARSYELICPHGYRSMPSNPYCGDNVCRSLQEKANRALVNISTQEVSHNDNRLIILPLALLVSIAVCAIFFLQSVASASLVFRTAIIGNFLIGAFLAVKFHRTQHSRLSIGWNESIPIGFLARTINLQEPKAKKLVYTPDMIRKIDLGSRSESAPAQYLNVSITLEIDGETKIIRGISLSEAKSLILQEELSEEVLSQIPVRDRQHTFHTQEIADSMKGQGVNPTSILSEITVFALEHPR